MNWGINEWVAVISAIVAVVSFGLNWIVVRRQTELQYETLRAEMDAEVIAWTHEAIDQVSQAIAIARGRGLTYSATRCGDSVSSPASVFHLSLTAGVSFFRMNRLRPMDATKRLRFRATVRQSSTQWSLRQRASAALTPM